MINYFKLKTKKLNTNTGYF